MPCETAAHRSLGCLIGLGSLYVLLLLLPFSNSAIEIAFGGILLGWGMERWDRRTRGDTLWLRPSFRPLRWAVIAFLAVCALSIAVSRHLPESLKGFVGKWLEYILFFIFIADLGVRPGVVRRAAWVTAAASIMVVIEGVTQEIWGKGLLRGYILINYFRMTGPYTNPIDLATYLMVAILLLLGLAAGEGRWYARLALGGVLTALLACLGRTLAFGAWLSFGVALAMLIWRGGALRRPALAVLAATVLVVGFFTAHHRGGGIVSLSDVGTGDRVVMWRAALGMIRDRPMLGHGVNTFMANYLDYWVGGERMPRYAHNCYLQVAAETGLVGLAAFLWLLWLVFTRITRVLSSSRDFGDRSLLAGLAAGLLAFVIQAGYDTNFYAMRQVAMFWVLAGLAVGLSERAASLRDEQ